MRTQIRVSGTADPLALEENAARKKIVALDATFPSLVPRDGKQGGCDETETPFAVQSGLLRGYGRDGA